MSITSKPSNENYRAGWDRTFARRPEMITEVEEPLPPPSTDQEKARFYACLEGIEEEFSKAENNATAQTMDVLYDAVFYINYCSGLAEKHSGTWGPKQWGTSAYIVEKHRRLLKTCLVPPGLLKIVHELI